MGLFDDVQAGGSTTAPILIPVNGQTALVMGKSYEARLTLMGPYAADTPKKISDMLHFGEGLNNALASQHATMLKMIRIDYVDVRPPTAASTDSRLFRWDTFTCRVGFTKVGAGTPMLIIIGVIVAIVLFALGMLFVVTNKEVFERAQDLADKAKDFLKLSVAPLLAVGLAIFLWKR